MPRRNRNTRHRWPDPPPAEPDPLTPPSYEDMARELVKAGRCSVAILDHPHRLTTTEGTPQ